MHFCSELHTVNNQEDHELPGEIWEQAKCTRTGEILPSYRVSSHGRVEGPTGTRTFGTTDDFGYRVLKHAGQTHFVHRLVVVSFSGLLAAAGKVTNHKDGNKINNHIDNLEVVSQSENVRHAWGLRPRQLIQGRLRGTDAWMTFPSASEAAIRLGISSSNIYNCCNCRQRSAGGYEWRYLEGRGGKALREFHPEQLPDEEWRKLDTAGFMMAWNKTPCTH